MFIFCIVDSNPSVYQNLQDIADNMEGNVCSNFISIYFCYDVLFVTLQYTNTTTTMLF